MFSNIITIYGSALLVLQMCLFLPLPCTQALPITSKPIESTAEHLAWQAWLLLPPEQRNLEKSRKVTPKSIFSLPFRECPEGHHLYESRCIPTLNINQSELLTQQLLGLVIGEPNEQQGNVEYDYEDEEDVIMYEPAQKLSGELSGDLNGDTPQVPSQDEPLKFNIFQHKFSTADYDGADSASLEGSGGGGAPLRTPENQTSDGGVLSGNANFMDVYKQFLEKNVNATNDAFYYNNNNNNQTVDNNNPSMYNNASNNNSSSSAIFHLSTTLGDLQSESSSISSNVAVSSNATPIAQMFAISEIDAIALPAGTVTGSSSGMPIQAVDDFERSTQAHRVSLFKDDSAVQFLTTIIAEQQQQQRQDMAHLLQADALLPLTENATASVTATATTTRELESTVTASENLVGVDGLDFEATTVMNVDLESEMMGMVKAERTRSVTEGSGAADAMNAAELNFSTTTEPSDTTHIQLDETTIIESKKSKVEPVSTTTAKTITTTVTSETEADTESETETETHSSSSTSTTASVTAAAINKDEEDEAKVATITTKRIIPTTTAQLVSSAIIGEGKRQVAVSDDRFYKQFASGGGGGSGGGDEGKGKLMNAVSGSGVGVVDGSSVGRTSSSGSETSEINIEQELRMINALVKGNQQRRQQQQQRQIPTSETPATTTAWTSNAEAEPSSTTTTTNAESSFTTEIDGTDSTPATSKSNKATKPTMPTTTINMESTQQRDATATTTTTLITEQPSTVETETDAVETSTTTTKTPTAKGNTNAAETVASNTWPTVMPIVGERASTRLATSSIRKATPNVALQTNSHYRNWSDEERNELHRFFEFFAPAIAKTTTTTTTTTTTQAPSTFWWLPLGWNFDGRVEDDTIATTTDKNNHSSSNSENNNNTSNNKDHSDEYENAESLLLRLFEANFERQKNKGGELAAREG